MHRGCTTCVCGSVRINQLFIQSAAHHCDTYSKINYASICWRTQQIHLHSLCLARFALGPLHQNIVLYIIPHMFKQYLYLSLFISHTQNWELLMLATLQWNVNGTTAFDFVDHILVRVPWGRENAHIRQHAHTLVSVCCTG